MPRFWVTMGAPCWRKTYNRDRVGVPHGVGEKGEVFRMNELVVMVCEGFELAERRVWEEGVDDDLSGKAR